MPLPQTARIVAGVLLLPLCVLIAHDAGAAEDPRSDPSPTLSAELPPLTIGTAVRIALERNPALHQAANQIAAGEITVARRRADFTPDLNLTLTGAERFDRGAAADGRNYETASGTLGSGLNLFNGFGDVAALRGAQWSLAGLRDSYSREEQTLIFSAMTAFLQAMSDRELIGVRAGILEGSRRQLERVEAFYRAGSRPVSDLYQQQAETGGAELDLLSAERDYAVARLQLLQTIGLPPTAGIDLLLDDVSALESLLLARLQGPPDLAGLSRRADLQAAGMAYEATREDVVQARAGYWPTLNLSATLNSSYTGLDRGDGFSGQFFDDNPNAAVGLTLGVPLFDRQLARHQVAQARLRQDDARLTLRQRQLGAEAELGRAIEDFRTAQKLVGVTEARLTAARQALDAVEERYRVGAATLVELTQSRAAFASAGAERVRARYGLLSRAAAVAYYQGDWPQLRELLATLENPS